MKKLQPEASSMTVQAPEAAAAAPPAVRPATGLFAAAVVLSAFLLFLLQPMIAKRILAWFGGSSSVWILCLVFFQAALLAGYGYSHLLATRFPGRRQVWIHGGLLLASLLLLPAGPSDAWKPADPAAPGTRILWLLTATVGVPYFLLSTTTPLLQSWYARTHHRALPYRLFAFSNLSSLAALLAYPVLIEPWMDTPGQLAAWSGGYALFVLAALACGWHTRRSAPAEPRAAAPAAPAARGNPLVWAALAALGSAMQVAVTNHLCQNVASVAFLWVLPLTLYLLTFFLCFERDGWYRRNLFLVLLPAALAAMGYDLLFAGPGGDVRIPIAVFAGGMFVACMFFHGELARRRPAAGGLTLYYLALAAGGAAGGALVALGAPRVFRAYYELPVMIALTGMALLFVHYGERLAKDIALTAVAVACAVQANTYIGAFSSGNLAAVRNFYGGLRITEHDGVRRMVHGSTSHGAQFVAENKRRWATTYYGPRSGAGVALERLARAEGIRAGLIGLGTGTLAVYARPGDAFRFYELNPDVERLARSHFTFLAGARGRVEVVLGDGRLVLEREAPQGFDLLAVDAFSGDSIPVHLLTREALQCYLRHLRPDGVIAFHVSNWSFDLAPVVARLAADQGLESGLVQNTGDDALQISPADWVLVARDLARFRDVAHPVQPARRAWTDNASNLFEALKK
jgi:SAM-dependent methyltransferase